MVPAPGSPEKICAAIEEQQWADPVDLADLLTAMELSVGVGDAAEIWHRRRERMGVEDDGTGKRRIAAIRGRP